MFLSAPFNISADGLCQDERTRGVPPGFVNVGHVAGERRIVAGRELCDALRRTGDEFAAEHVHVRPTAGRVRVGFVDLPRVQSNLGEFSSPGRLEGIQLPPAHAVGSLWLPPRSPHDADLSEWEFLE